MQSQKDSRNFVHDIKANFELFDNQKHQTTCVSPNENGQQISRNPLKIVHGSTAGEYGGSSLIKFDSGSMIVGEKGEKVFLPSVNLVSLNDIDLFSQYTPDMFSSNSDIF
jgi:hypothetical protein